MYATPIPKRIEQVLDKKDSIFKLFDMQWEDKGIALYLSSDTRTIRRFRAAYNAYGKDTTKDHIMSFIGAK